MMVSPPSSDRKCVECRTRREPRLRAECESNVRFLLRTTANHQHKATKAPLLWPKGRRRNDVCGASRQSSALLGLRQNQLDLNWQSIEFLSPLAVWLRRKREPKEDPRPTTERMRVRLSCRSHRRHQMRCAGLQNWCVFSHVGRFTKRAGREPPARWTNRDHLLRAPLLWPRGSKRACCCCLVAAVGTPGVSRHHAGLCCRRRRELGSPVAFSVG